ncbi:MAG: choice-of-anchor Q domain-containing protein, partial [Planctomycetota bacterium]
GTVPDGAPATATLRNCTVLNLPVRAAAVENCTFFRADASGALPAEWAVDATKQNCIFEVAGSVEQVVGSNLNLGTAMGPVYFAAHSLVDFHLTSAATGAIDGGIVLTLAEDFEGQARPSGSAWDIGADEFIAAAFPVYFGTDPSHMLGSPPDSEGLFSGGGPALLGRINRLQTYRYAGGTDWRA